jgi:hypothetical protein
VDGQLPTCTNPIAPAQHVPQMRRDACPGCGWVVDAISNKPGVVGAVNETAGLGGPSFSTVFMMTGAEVAGKRLPSNGHARVWNISFICYRD